MARLSGWAVLLLIPAGLLATPRPAQAIPIQATRLGDGVILWTPAAEPADKSVFFKKFEDLAKVVLPSRAELPFDRSVAFLVGVSRYTSLNPLPFVKNDLQDMKDYLLQNGFDQVYVASDEIVSYPLVESYMMNKFPAELGSRDRLLFYYAGHGADARGRTGYLQFSNARQGDFARHVLPISHVLEWGRVNEAAHMLFLLDTCSSGLAFTARGSGDDERLLIQTLSGRGSRAVVTAGTADEETFEVRKADGRGNGVFTRALLAVLQQGKAQRNAPPFLTIGQVMADLQVSVGKFAAENRKSLNPRLWTFDDDEYRGSFVFLNPAVQGAPIKEGHLVQLRAVPRGEEPVMVKPPEAAQAQAASPPGPESDTAFRQWLRETFGERMVLTNLRKHGVTLRGKIETREGKPLEGVNVTLVGRSTFKPVVSDAQGEFALYTGTAIGLYDLTAAHEDYPILRKKLRISASSVSNLEESTSP